MERKDNFHTEFGIPRVEKSNGPVENTQWLLSAKSLCVGIFNRKSAYALNVSPGMFWKDTKADRVCLQLRRGAGLLCRLGGAAPG